MCQRPINSATLSLSTTGGGKIFKMAEINLNHWRHLHQKFQGFKGAGIFGEKFEPPEAPAPEVPGFQRGGHFW